MISIACTIIHNDNKVLHIIINFLNQNYNQWSFKDFIIQENRLLFTAQSHCDYANFYPILDFCIQQGIKEILGKISMDWTYIQPSVFKVKNGILIEEAENLLEFLQVNHVEEIDLYARDSCGNTPLHLAVEAARADFVAELLAMGADIEARNCSKATAVFMAINEDVDEITALHCIKLLVEAGCQLEIKDNTRNTPLKRAMMLDLPYIVEYLEKII